MQLSITLIINSNLDPILPHFRDMTSRTVSCVEPAALLELHVVADDEVDKRREDDARKNKLGDGNPSKDRRKH